MDGRDVDTYRSRPPYRDHGVRHRGLYEVISSATASRRRLTARRAGRWPQPSFAFKAHDGCVKAIAGGGRHLSTCGSDHTVCVYNLRKMRGQEKLLQQDGGALLQCLTFYADSHLVSGGSDGELCIWRTSDWACLLRMKGHKGAVHSIAVHPSGRAALSVAADRLMLWNLTTGKCNYTAALSAPAWLVHWSPGGELYAHEMRQAVLIYSLRSSSAAHTAACGVAAAVARIPI